MLSVWKIEVSHTWAPTFVYVPKVVFIVDSFPAQVWSKWLCETVSSLKLLAIDFVFSSCKPVESDSTCDRTHKHEPLGTLGNLESSPGRCNPAQVMRSRSSRLQRRCHQCHDKANGVCPTFELPAREEMEVPGGPGGGKSPPGLVHSE